MKRVHVWMAAAALFGASAATAAFDPSEFTLMQDAPPAAEPPGAPPVAEPPPPTSWGEGWKGNVEGGLNGSTGNSEVLNLRAAFNALRKTPKYETTFNLQYLYARDDGDTSKNRGETSLRNDWLFGESPWRIYAIGKAEYDEFQDWDVRLSALAGVGYEFVDDGRTFLLGRAGIGIAKEIGGSKNEIIPEGNLGIDFTHKLTERQQIYANLDYYPSFEALDDYRIIGKAGWEIVIDPEMQLSLKLGVEDRYDSIPGGSTERNDFDYFALLSWTF